MSEEAILSEDMSALVASLDRLFEPEFAADRRSPAVAFEWLAPVADLPVKLGPEIDQRIDLLPEQLAVMLTGAEQVVPRRVAVVRMLAPRAAGANPAGANPPTLESKWRVARFDKTEPSTDNGSSRYRSSLAQDAKSWGALVQKPDHEAESSF